MIEAILPPLVASAELFHDPPDARMLPEEAPLVARAVPRRRAEFTTGRHCARLALASLGVEPAAILAGPDRAPRWPAGIVGTITHCDGYRAAAVARTGDLASIGIDAEPAGPLPDGVLPRIALPAEVKQIRHLATARPDVCWDRLLFCAKESVYKAWSPLMARWLGFEEVVVALDPGANAFTATLTTPAETAGGTLLTGFSGNWLASDGLIITSVVVWPFRLTSAIHRPEVPSNLR